MPEPVGDATMSALHYALNGLALRQRTIADNTANIETPGFLAGKVNFEDSLRGSVADGTDPFGSRGYGDRRKRAVAKLFRPNETPHGDIHAHAPKC